MSFPAEKPDDLQFYVKLMTEHQANLRAFIVSLMPGSPDVADALQETNATLWQKRGKYKEGTNFLAWAFQIARYEVYRQRDRTKRNDRLVFSLKVVQALAQEGESVAIEDELYVALDDCLAKLSEKQRELIWARYTPGKSLEKLAECSGRSAGSLRIALLRVREALKTCVDRTISQQSA
ncbi:MAG: sigma-70 family RNA polymerase sigma factor [Luteolibacter sp.]